MRIKVLRSLRIRRIKEPQNKLEGFVKRKASSEVIIMAEQDFKKNNMNVMSLGDISYYD